MRIDLETIFYTQIVITRKAANIWRPFDYPVSLIQLISRNYLLKAFLNSAAA